MVTAVAGECYVGVLDSRHVLSIVTSILVGRESGALLNDLMHFLNML